MKDRHTVTIEGDSLDELRELLGTRTYKETVQKLVDKAAVYSNFDEMFREIKKEAKHGATA